MEENTVKYQLAVRELNEMAVFDDWLEKKEALETAKEQFEMIDKPFRKKLFELFENCSFTLEKYLQEMGFQLYKYFESPLTEMSTVIF